MLFELDDDFRGHGLAEVFPAPIDVILTNHDVVQPDIVVVADPRQISVRAIEGPPLLMVEVLSPESRAHDQTVKAPRCATLGVTHYWFVEPEAKAVECHRLENGQYEMVARGEADSTVSHPDWPNLALDLRAVWP